MSIAIPKQESFVDEQIDSKLLQLELAKEEADKVGQPLNTYKNEITIHKFSKAVFEFAEKKQLMVVEAELEKRINSGYSLYVDGKKVTAKLGRRKTNRFDSTWLSNFDEPIPADILSIVALWRNKLTQDFKDVNFQVCKPIFQRPHLDPIMLLNGAKPGQKFIIATWDEFYAF